ncbi:MAG TPA: ankyrin repeat domain-containing protein [Flavobacterium sp.]|jgi:ankyrin repeat protein|uniref:ankyrin repeat domain-containing protein n=1 Tax=Flavobacterium sp. TaxID=239 RepID=UPI002BB880DA|nr:ankyrin repeat domain-containing protein [Flavobacterium sp.]MCA0348067.1 ankyrin repeat domain-containing protein [Bacteroidota bacterium]HPW97358.1 ankyrin repeat domain-containing protein [Flavobacterium sp.]HQA74746.1 ankyrin repeat domain-containing protein [Flavobacterium sp.]
MVKTIIHLSLALVAFANVSFASQQVTSETRTELMYSSNTPLCLAIVKGDVETVKKFIEYGANVNETSNGLTPLMIAARYNKVEILKLLVDNGAHVNAKDEKGYTALKYATLSNATAAIAYLKDV